MKHQRLLWMALLALPLALSATGCSKPSSDVSGHGTPASETEKEPFGRLTVEALEAKMTEAKAGKVALAIFDTNQRERYDQSHIATAKWVKSNAVTAGDLPADKDTTLVFYCANDHWMACHTGAVSAVKLGYKNVFILPAGIMGWEKAQKPIERG